MHSSAQRPILEARSEAVAAQVVPASEFLPGRCVPLRQFRLQPAPFGERGTWRRPRRSRARSSAPGLLASAYSRRRAVLPRSASRQRPQADLRRPSFFADSCSRWNPEADLFLSPSGSGTGTLLPTGAADRASTTSPPISSSAAGPTHRVTRLWIPASGRRVYALAFAST